MSAGREAVSLDGLLVRTSRTFALSIPLLPEPTRREVTVAYLLFRIADTLEDATAWPAARQIEELEAFALLLSQPSEEGALSLSAHWSAHPPVDNTDYLDLLSETPAVVEAWQRLAAAARDEIGRHTLRTVERMARFVGRAENLQSLDELRDYCYAVAGIVGEMLTELFLLGSPALRRVAGELRGGAVPFGEALQLVNILRDSTSDEREGRRYLPAGVATPDVFALARHDLDRAISYVCCLEGADAPRGLVAFTALPVLLARATLDRVERDGPGAKLSRPEVLELKRDMDAALEKGTSLFP